MNPWPHAVVDNYYPTEQFESMRQEIINNIKARHPTNKQTFYRSTDADFKHLFPYTFACAASVSPYTQLGAFKTSRPYNNLSSYVEVNVIFDGHDYPIHDENPRKILSIVNYVAPENSTGTLIYDENKTYYSEIEWKQNRTLVFPGITGLTWHAYRVQPRSLRITLNTFLVDDTP